MLHTNELPLKHLITNLDGPTNSMDGFKGPIGKLLSKVNQLKWLEKFELIRQIEPLIKIPDDILKSMSTDASLSYKLVSCLESGILNPSLVNRKCGNLCHRRWLTTGQAILWLYISEHGLEGDILKNLKVLSQFVAQVYFHMWFRIKVKHSIVNGPHHLIKLLYL